MPGTFQTNGAIADRTPSQGQGGMSTGIGCGGSRGGPPQQTPTVADFVAARIGGNIGSQVDSTVVVGGSGYTNGVYLLNAANGGLVGGGGGGGAELTVTVAGGIITSATVSNPGRGYAAAPTVVITALGAGTLGTITATILADGSVVALGSTYGLNKGTRYLTAAGAVPVNGVVSATYLNRSPDALVAGQSVWAVAP